MRGKKVKYDKKSVEKLFKEHYSRLCSFAYRYVKDNDSAEDIVQQFFVDFIFHRRYKKVTSSIESYLYKSITYAAFNYLKKKSQIVHCSLDEIEIGIYESEQEQKIDFQKQLADSIKILPPKCKEVFEMVHIQRLSYQETADALGVSINTVKTQVKRAHQIIRGEIVSPF